MSKKINLIIMLLGIICVWFIFATLAFYTYINTANNIITFGNIKIKLLQTTLDENNVEKNVNVNEKINITNTDTLSRIIKVENSGNQEIFLRISLDMTRINEYNQEFNADALVKYKLNNEDWIYANGWFYYKNSIKQKEITSNLITNIKFDVNTITDNYSRDNFRFDIIAQAVQAKNNANNVLEVVGWPTE